MNIQQLRARLQAARQTFESGDARSNPDAFLRDVDDLKRSAFAEMDQIMKGARAAARDLHASEQRAYDGLERVFDEAQALRDRATATGPDPVFGAMRDGAESPEIREAFTGYLRTGHEGELRALGVSTDSAGGYTVPEGFRNQITERLKAFGGLRRLATVLTTDDGTDLPWPTNDDTDNPGAIQAENTAVGEQDLLLGQKTLASRMYTSKVVRVSIQLVQDSGVNLEQFLSRKLGERIGRAQAPHWVIGNGTSEPQGITAGTVGKTGGTGQETSVIYDDLVDLIHSVDPAYREDEAGVAWVMRDTTLAAIRKIKDADGRPLLEPNVQGGTPNRLLGHRVVIDQAMPAMEAGARSIGFGHWESGYVIRDVGRPSVLRFTERWGEYLQVGFLAFQRSDGLIQDGEAFRLYRNTPA